jgi:hypothetical protein
VVGVSRQVFVVTIVGEMDRQLLEEFDDVEVTIDHGVTRLRVVSADASVLYGVLNRVDAFGLELLEVHQAEERPAP